MARLNRIILAGGMVFGLAGGPALARLPTFQHFSDSEVNATSPEFRGMSCEGTLGRQSPRRRNGVHGE